jgi:hypothetical protein
LEVTCKVCNILHYVRLRFGDKIADAYKIAWAPQL